MTAGDPLAADYAKQLWALSSAVVAFCVLQGLTFAYALQKEAFRSQVAAKSRAIRISIGIALVLYSGCVAVLEWRQIGIIRAIAPYLATTVMIVAAMKVVAIVITCGAISWLCGHLASNRAR